MKVLEIKVLRGPNYWSIKKQKLIQMLLDLEELEHCPTHQIPCFYDRIQALLPSLYHHQCSEEAPGGFFYRVKEGTWMGHVIEHIALEIQSLAGMDVVFGRTRGTGKEGIYHVVFSYAGEEAGKYAAKAAVRIAEALISGETYDIKQDIATLQQLWLAEKLGPSTGAIVEEAMGRGIPCMRLDDNAYVQLGYGAKQKRIEATIAETTSSIAVDIAGNKDLTKKILTEAYIPVPEGVIVASVDKLKEAVAAIGYPLVVKPLDGNHGKGATINIASYNEVVTAFERAKKISEKVIVERFVQGNDYRVLVVNNQFVAAALRTPACVTGDGVHTIEQLIDIVNSDPRRGAEHEKVLTAIKVDALTVDLLAKRNYTLQTVLPKGYRQPLKPTANLSTGGTAKDVTDEVHPANIALFERVARTVGLNICGIDVMAPDLQTPLNDNGGAVLEVNAAPGFRMHLEPTEGVPRNITKPVVDMLFPGKDNGRIPLVAVTGTNGKTTTTRLIAHMAQAAGYATGYTTTDGIYVNKEFIVKGDCSGPQSAQFILKDRAVEFAVLETARGGILRSGLGFDKCNCAVVTNVAEDHLGLDGINTLEKLARVKSVVPETVVPEGYAILNADDDLTYSMRENVHCNVALFSMYPHSVRIERHCAGGGLAAVCENGYILLRKGNQIIPIEEIRNIPITFGGKAEFNIANAMAACLAAYTNGIKVGVISKVLKTFVPSHETTPGRVNMYEFNDFKIMLDYAHNPHGVKALGKLVKAIEASVRIGIITGVGDRRDEDIIALGEEAAHIFDEIIIRHDEDLRGRAPDVLDELLRKGIQRVDPAKSIRYFPCECEAVEHSIFNARHGALIVVLIENINKVSKCIAQRQAMEKQKEMSYKNAV